MIHFLEVGCYLCCFFKKGVQKDKYRHSRAMSGLPAGWTDNVIASTIPGPLSAHLHLIKIDLGPWGMVSSDLKQINQPQPGRCLLLLRNDRCNIPYRWSWRCMIGPSACLLAFGAEHMLEQNRLCRSNYPLWSLDQMEDEWTQLIMFTFKPLRCLPLKKNKKNHSMAFFFFGLDIFTTASVPLFNQWPISGRQERCCS